MIEMCGREVWLGQVDGEGGGRARSESDERSAQRSVGRSVGRECDALPSSLLFLPFSLSPLSTIQSPRLPVQPTQPDQPASQPSHRLICPPTHPT